MCFVSPATGTGKSLLWQQSASLATSLSLCGQPRTFPCKYTLILHYQIFVHHANKTIIKMSALPQTDFCTTFYIKTLHNSLSCHFSRFVCQPPFPQSGLFVSVQWEHSCCRPSPAPAAPTAPDSVPSRASSWRMRFSWLSSHSPRCSLLAPFLTLFSLYMLCFPERSPQASSLPSTLTHYGTPSSPWL